MQCKVNKYIYTNVLNEIQATQNATKNKTNTKSERFTF